MKLYEVAGGERSDARRAEQGVDFNPLWFQALAVPEAHLPPEDFEVVLLGDAVGAVTGRDRIFKKSVGDGMVFIDGSAMAPLTAHARAAGAAGQFDGEGNLICGFSVAVPRRWPQTAAAAEHLAYAWCDALSEQGVIPVVDCASVVTSARRGRAYATHERRPWAALWAGTPGRLGPVVKVKAHTTRQESANRGEEHLWRGNDAVDALAKDRARRMLPPTGFCSHADAASSARAKFFVHAARALASYPSARSLVPSERLVEAEALATTSLVLYREHEVVCSRHRGLMVCLRCHRSCRIGRRAIFRTTPCSEGVAAAVSTWNRARELGHRPAVSFVLPERTPVVCCLRCGAYCEVGARGLAEPCRAAGKLGYKIPKGTAYRLSLFVKGQHPRRVDVQMDGPFFRLPELPVWTQPAGPFGGWHAPEEEAPMPSSGMQAELHSGIGTAERARPRASWDDDPEFGFPDIGDDPEG